MNILMIFTVLPHCSAPAKIVLERIECGSTAASFTKGIQVRITETKQAIKGGLTKASAFPFFSSPSFFSGARRLKAIEYLKMLAMIVVRTIYAMDLS